MMLSMTTGNREYKGDPFPWGLTIPLLIFLNLYLQVCSLLLLQPAKGKTVQGLSHSPSSSLQLIPEALSSAPIRPLCCPPQAKPSFTKHWCRALTLFKTSVATSPLLDSCYSHEFAISVAIYLYSLTKSLQFYGSSSHRPSPVKHLVSYLMINPLPTIPSDHLLISKARLN